MRQPVQAAGRPVSAERLARLATEYAIRAEMDAHPVERADWPHGDEPSEPEPVEVERGRRILWQEWEG